MTEPSKRSTIYFDPRIHAALRLKAAQGDRSVSEIVNDAVRAALAEDHTDIEAAEERASEETLSYSELLKDLKAHGRL